MKQTSAHQLSLHGTWCLENVKKLDGRDIAIDMTIPGDTVSALVQERCIPDPYYGENENDCKWIGCEDWKISREFSVDEEVLSYEHVFLSMKFVDTFASVFINEKKIGMTSNAFCAYTFDAKDVLQKGTNTIAVVFESPLDVGAHLGKTLPFPIPATQNFPQYIREANINTIRKPHCHGGWDWGITLMVSGIYESISLECRNNTAITAVTHMQKHSDGVVELLSLIHI